MSKHKDCVTWDQVGKGFCILLVVLVIGMLGYAVRDIQQDFINRDIKSNCLSEGLPTHFCFDTLFRSRK